MELRRGAVLLPRVLRPIAGGPHQRSRRAPTVGPLLGAGDQGKPLVTQPVDQALVAFGIALLYRQRHFVPERQQPGEHALERVDVLLLLGDDENLHRGV